MRKFLLVLGLFAASLAANAQSAITLAKTNVTGQVAGPYLYYTASSTGAVAPSTGTNQAWDYSALTGSTLQSHNLVAAPVFSPTAVVDTNEFQQAVIPGAYIYAQSVYDIDNNGYFISGNKIPMQSYSEANLTGNSKDSTYWPAQYFHARDNTVQFPSTMGSAWTQTNSHNLNFSLTVTAFGLKKAPVKIVKHTHIKDTVVGWGALKIPSAHNSSIAYNVLLIREHSVTVDSFYLNGSAAPPQLLTAFKVTQNDTSVNDYSEYFVRAGTGNALLTMDFGSDNTYTTPTSVTYDADNVQSGIENEGFDPQVFNIYPNPAPAGTINFKFLKTSEMPWKLSLVNTLGQIVKTMPVEGNGNLNMQLDCTGYRPGLYFVQVADENGNSMVSAKMDIVK